MATLKPDINITRGDDASINFELLDSDGSPVDLTGSTVFFTAKPTVSDSADDSDASIEKTVTSHSDPTNGQTVIALSNTDTDVDPGEYYYDIQVKNSGGVITSIRYRKLKIWGDVTRRTT